MEKKKWRKYSNSAFVFVVETNEREKERGVRRGFWWAGLADMFARTSKALFAERDFPIKP